MAIYHSYYWHFIIKCYIYFTWIFYFLPCSDSNVKFINWTIINKIEFTCGSSLPMTVVQWLAIICDRIKTNCISYEKGEQLREQRRCSTKQKNHIIEMSWISLYFSFLVPISVSLVRHFNYNNFQVKKIK